jgi:ABC-type amino acid transport substrate-binding protein
VQRHWRRSLLLAALLGLATLLLWQVAWPAWSAQRRFDSLRVLRVGTDPALQPFSFFAADGWRGFDADLAALLSAELNLELQPIPVGFDGRYDALDRQLVDVVISAVSIDLTQTERVAYSQGYIDIGPRLLVSVTQALAQPPEVFANRRVAVAAGGAADKTARYHARRSVDLRRVPVGDDAAAIAALRSGAADAAIVDGLTAIRAGCPLRGDGVAAWRCIALAPQPYVAVVRKSDTRLLRAIDAALVRLQGSGAIDVLASKWLR